MRPLGRQCGAWIHCISQGSAYESLNLIIIIEQRGAAQFLPMAMRHSGSLRCDGDCAGESAHVITRSASPLTSPRPTRSCPPARTTQTNRMKTSAAPTDGPAVAPIQAVNR